MSSSAFVIVPFDSPATPMDTLVVFERLDSGGSSNLPTAPKVVVATSKTCPVPPQP